jgi:hypothetical protein
LSKLLVNFACAIKHSQPFSMRRKSGGGPPQSKTLARGTKRAANVKRLDVRQSSGAFWLVLRKNWEKISAS